MNSAELFNKFCIGDRVVVNDVAASMTSLRGECGTVTGVTLFADDADSESTVELQVKFDNGQEWEIPAENFDRV